MNVNYFNDTSYIEMRLSMLKVTFIYIHVCKSDNNYNIIIMLISKGLVSFSLSWTIFSRCRHTPAFIRSLTPIHPEFPSSTKMATALDFCHGSLIRNRVWARNISVRELLKTLLFVRYRDNSSDMGQDHYIETESEKWVEMSFKF